MGGSASVLRSEVSRSQLQPHGAHLICFELRSKQGQLDSSLQQLAAARLFFKSSGACTAIALRLQLVSTCAGPVGLQAVSGPCRDRQDSMVDL